MRKWMIAFLIFALAINPALCQAGVDKLHLGGLVLMVGGTFLAIDGFSTTKKTYEWDERTIDKEWDENGVRFITYKIVHRVEHSNKSDPVLGGLGLSIFAIGTYSVIAYFVDLKRLKREAGIEIEIAKKKDTAYLLLSKKF